MPSSPLDARRTPRAPRSGGQAECPASRRMPVGHSAPKTQRAAQPPSGAASLLLSAPKTQRVGRLASPPSGAPPSLPLSRPKIQRGASTSRGQHDVAEARGPPPLLAPRRASRCRRKPRPFCCLRPRSSGQAECPPSAWPLLSSALAARRARSDRPKSRRASQEEIARERGHTSKRTEGMPVGCRRRPFCCLHGSDAFGWAGPNARPRPTDAALEVTARSSTASGPPPRLPKDEKSGGGAAAAPGPQLGRSAQAQNGRGERRKNRPIYDLGPLGCGRPTDIRPLRTLGCRRRKGRGARRAGKPAGPVCAPWSFRASL
jgi:hypothetical protein